MEDNLTSHERRIARLEDQMVDVRLTLKTIEADMSESRRLLFELRNSTEELVTISKGVRLVGRIAAWGGGITTFAAAVYAALNFTPK